MVRGTSSRYKRNFALNHKKLEIYYQKEGCVNYKFLKESVALFPGRWTHVGENSPIKHKTVLRCTLAKRKKLSFDDDKEIEEELQTKDSRISSKSKTVNVDNYSCHDKEQLSGNGLSIC